MFHSSSVLNINRPFSLLFQATAGILFLLISAAPASGTPGDALHADRKRTVSLYQRNGCLTSAQQAYGKEIIKALDYTSQRAFRKFCTIPRLEFKHYQKIWSVLINHRLTYAQVQSFEQWFDIFSPDLPLCLKAVEKIRTLSFDGCRTFNLLLRLSDATPRFCLEIIPIFNKLSRPRLQTVEGMLSIQDMTADRMLDTLEFISRLRGHQHAAAKAFARTLSMDSNRFLTALHLIGMLDQEDAWNAHTLYRDEKMSAEEAWDWLIGFFALPDDIQENSYFTLDQHRQARLLDAMHNGGETLIWKLNNLHSITDRFGVEFSKTQLLRTDPKILQQKLYALSPAVYQQFAASFSRALRKNDQAGMITILRSGVAKERAHVASSLTSANIYALLAMGSELYDSSFRDILVPVLHQRIHTRFNGDLLKFLAGVDPRGEYTADFITACAAKGKLTLFFPDQAERQKDVLALTARSAFRDDHSLLLFSATMLPLFRMLEPDARSYLIELMASQSINMEQSTGVLMAFTLAYYKRFHRAMLTPTDLVRIERVEQQLHPPPFEKFRHTPFDEWIKDYRLGSLSTFHADDDGRASFISFAGRLRNDGYTLSPAKGYNQAVSIPSPSMPSAGKRFSDGELAALFASMKRYGYCVNFSKTINNISINHTFSVYANPEHQQKLLLHYFASGDEMLIQRGHSYWRRAQLTGPIRTLSAEGRLKADTLSAKQRFLSLGSCGGLKVYTRLSDLFAGKVDILATIGTGLTGINDAYNKLFPELAARYGSGLTWSQVTEQTGFIFKSGRGGDYIHPGSLTSILHKILHQNKRNKTAPTDRSKG